MKKFRIKLQHVLAQERYRKRLTPLPFFFTFANAFLGFISIVQALEGNYNEAVYCIMLAAVMDTFDGRLARALGSSSALGVELDSLADGISFGLAPCVLVYTWYPGTVGFTGFVALGCYLSAGLYRLARFNLTSSEQSVESRGLPIPLAAFFVVSLVLYQQWILQHRVWFMLYKRVPFLLILAIAGLMVSSIPFPTFKHYRATLRWYHYLLVLLGWVLLLYLFMIGYPLLLAGVGGYIMLSMIRWLFTYTAR